MYVCMILAQDIYTYVCVYIVHIHIHVLYSIYTTLEGIVLFRVPLCVAYTPQTTNYVLDPLYKTQSCGTMYCMYISQPIVSTTE